MLIVMRFLAALLLSAPLAALAQKPSPWQLEPSETTADLRGVHAVGGGVVWASGTNGTVLRSQDSGFEWQNCATPPGAEKLDFRAIWAWDDQTAVVMSSGTGALSRIYKTTDGCAHWTLLYTNPDKDGFWDELVFLDRSHGFLLGDPPGPGATERYTLLWTSNGGIAWTPAATPGLEAGIEPRGAFAASNSSLLMLRTDFGFFGTGGAHLYSLLPDDLRFRGQAIGGRLPHASWTRSTLPLAHEGDAAGVFSLACHCEPVSHGQSGRPVALSLLAVGGDYRKPDERQGTAAWSSDDGRHWTAAATPPGGYRSAVAWDPDLKLWIAAGPNGSDVSRDDGRTWAPLEHAPADAPKGGEWNALSLPWAVGPHGRIGKLNPEALRK